METEIVGYLLVDQNNSILQSWGGVWGQCPGIPTSISLPNGDQVEAPSVNVEYGGCKLIPWEMSEPAPSTNPADYPLADWQLRKGLIVNGYSIDAIEATIKAIPDAAEREIRWMAWDRPTVIKWDSPATQEFMAWLGIPAPYAEAMWLAAKDYALDTSVPDPVT